MQLFGALLCLLLVAAGFCFIIGVGKALLGRLIGLVIVLAVLLPFCATLVTQLLEGAQGLAMPVLVGLFVLGAVLLLVAYSRFRIHQQRFRQLQPERRETLKRTLERR